MTTNDEYTLKGALRSTQERVLAAPMNKYTGATSVGDFLRQCLLNLWDEQECFSEKRPLGDSGWAHDIAFALVKAGLLEGKIDEDDDLLDFDHKGLNRLVQNAINYLFEGTKGNWEREIALLKSQLIQAHHLNAMKMEEFMQQFTLECVKVAPGEMLGKTVRELIDSWDRQVDHDPLSPDGSPYTKACDDFDDAMNSLRQQVSTTFAGKPECPFCIRRSRALDHIQNLIDDYTEEANDRGLRVAVDAINSAIAEGLREDDRWNKEKK